MLQLLSPDKRLVEDDIEEMTVVEDLELTRHRQMPVS